MKKVYNQATLPFMGQKRRWNTEFKTALVNNFADCNTFVDLFGGSGLLSHFTKTVRPDAQVVYNDFDGYAQRLAAIPITNAIISDLRTILKDVHESKRVVEPYRGRVMELLERYDKQGFVDYITLSCSLLFSGKYATSLEELRKDTLYNNLRLSDYNADNYLDGLTIVHEDYRQLFKRYRHRSDVCFLIDPPYLSTQSCTYTGYWKLRDYLDVLRTLNGTDYFYFTSEKSSILELFEFLEQEYNLNNPFKGATRIDIPTHINYNSAYVDIMLYRNIKRQEKTMPATAATTQPAASKAIHIATTSNPTKDAA